MSDVEQKFRVRNLKTTFYNWAEERSSYDKKKNRSLELDVKAIDTLIKEVKTISYRTVSDKSKVIDPEGIGIHQNTISKNQELHNHFLQYRTTELVDLLIRMEQYIANQNQHWLKSEFEKSLSTNESYLFNKQ